MTIFIGFAPGDQVYDERLNDVIHPSLGGDSSTPIDVKGSDIAILLDGTGQSPTASQIRIAELIRALNSRCRLFLFFGPESEKSGQSPYGSWLLDRLGIAFSRYEPLMEVQSVHESLADYFTDNVATALITQGDGDVLGHAVDRQGDIVGPASLHLEHASSDVYIAPISSARKQTMEAQRFVESVPPNEEYPEYLDELSEDARSAKERLKAIENELLEVQQTIDRAQRETRLLYYSSFDLEAEVVRFLNETLQIPAVRAEGNNEDFWLVRAEDKWCIGEVKSPGKGNVQRQDISDLDSHRRTAGLPPDFPALLVVNTFHRRHNLKQRDTPVGGDEFRRAGEDHILIARTLDLYRLGQKVSSPAPTDIAAALVTGGGWFEVDSGGNINIHR